MNDFSHDEVVRLARIAFRARSVIDSELARIVVAAAAASGRLETLVSEAVAEWTPDRGRHLFEQLIDQGHKELASRYSSHSKIEVGRAALKELARAGYVGDSPREKRGSPHALDERDIGRLRLLLDCPVPLEDVVAPLLGSNQLARQEVLRLLLPMAVAVAPALIAYLETTRPAISPAVQELLAATGDRRVLPWLANEGGIKALARIGGPWAADVILDLAVNADSVRRHVLDTATAALASMGPVGAAAVKRILATKEILSVEIGEMAGHVCGAEITPTLIALLGHGSAGNRQAAIAGLVKLGEVAIDEVAALLDAPNEETRRDALEVLARGGHDAAVARILTTWRVRAADDQRLLINALANFEDPQAWEALTRIYDDGSPDTQLSVVKSLRFTSIRPGVGGWPLLMRALSASDARLREAAAQALRHTRPDALGFHLGALIDVLIRMQADDEPAVMAAAEVLDRWSDDHQVRRSIRVAITTNEGRVRDRLRRLIESAEERERGRIERQSRFPGAGGGFYDRVPDAWDGEPGLHRPITDAIWFSVTAPAAVAAGTTFVIDVWAHERSAQREILRIARAWTPHRPVRHRSQGPHTMRRGAELTVVASIDGLTVAEPVATLLWIGARANCSFAVTVPPATASGCRVGTVQILLGPLRIATVHFEVEVGRAASDRVTDVGAAARWVRSAFASYAHEDRADVVARIQGMQKLAPHLDVFLDVVSLRSGETWKARVEEEVQSRDTFYLFWSVAASRSRWVDAEWRLALSKRGLAYIDPVPLESPSVAPPPHELASLHFNDWTIELWRAASFS